MDSPQFCLYCVTGHLNISISYFKRLPLPYKSSYATAICPNIRDVLQNITLAVNKTCCQNLLSLTSIQWMAACHVCRCWLTSTASSKIVAQQIHFRRPKKKKKKKEKKKLRQPWLSFTVTRESALMSFPPMSDFLRKQ